jgi:type III restriction enzyme
VLKCHLNCAVADTKQWEQSAPYFIDTSDIVDAFVKNSGLGFAIPYLHNGQMHDYIPDFIIRLKTHGTCAAFDSGDEGLRPLGRRETCDG